MSYLRVHPANPINFWYETGVGKINNGVSIDANYEYTETGIKTFYDCTGLFYGEDFCQPYKCTDSTSFQFTYGNDTDKVWPVVEVLDSTDTAVDYVLAEYVNTDGDGNRIYQVDLDFSDTSIFTCGACYKITITSYQTNSAQTACWNDRGTVNWIEGGSNTFSAELAIFRTGSSSTKVDAPGVPVLIDRTIGYCDNMTFSANTVYTISIWVYEPSGSTGFSDGNPYSWDITRDLSDATVITEKKVVIPTPDAVDTWHQVVTTFKTGSDTTGNIYLVIDSTPAAAGVAFMDDLEFDKQGATPVTELEATSQELCVSNDHDCTVGITYSADVDAFQLDYTTTEYGTTFAPFVRVPGKWHQVRWEDPDHQIDEDSERTAKVVVTASQKIRTFRTATMPEYMLETVALAIKHPNLALNGVDFVCVTANITPEWSSEAETTATIDIDLRLKAYDNQLSNC